LDEQNQVKLLSTSTSFLIALPRLLEGQRDLLYKHRTTIRKDQRHIEGLLKWLDAGKDSHPHRDRVNELWQTLGGLRLESKQSLQRKRDFSLLNFKLESDSAPKSAWS